MKKLLFLALMFTRLLSAASWEPPLDLSNNAPGNGDGVIVVDSEGNAAVIWQDNNTQAILTSYRYYDQGWEGPTVLDAIGEPDPYICVDEEGNLRAVWEFGSTIRTATKPFGAAWTPFVQIYTRKASYDNIRVASVKNNGYAVVSWFEDSGGSQNVVALTYDGTSWSSTFLNNTANQTVTTSSKPIPHILPDGTTHIAFIATDVGSGNDDIYTSVGSAATGTWATITGRGTTKPQYFDFAQSATGNGGIVYLDGANAVNAAYYLGGSWGSFGSVYSPGAKEAKIGIDQNSMVTIVYGTTVGDIQKASTNATAISYQIATISPGTVGFHSPRLSVSENGGMVTSYIGTGGEVYGQVGANGAFEATPTFLNILAKNENVAMSNNGTAFALWKDTSGTGFMEASRTFNPTDYLIRSLGKKRLIMNKGLFP